MNQMACYVYRCEAGHQFEQQGKMNGSDAPKKCPICAAVVQKVLAAPARVFPGADSWRR